MPQRATMEAPGLVGIRKEQGESMDKVFIVTFTGRDGGEKVNP